MTTSVANTPARDVGTQSHYPPRVRVQKAGSRLDKGEVGHTTTRCTLGVYSSAHEYFNYLSAKQYDAYMPTVLHAGPVGRTIQSAITSPVALEFHLQSHSPLSIVYSQCEPIYTIYIEYLRGAHMYNLFDVDASV